MICCDGPPTPRTGPCRPGAAAAATTDWMPRPAARPTPGPAAAPGRGTLATPSYKVTLMSEQFILHSKASLHMINLN